MSTPRSEANLNVKPRSSRTETQVRAVAVARRCYLALYRLVLTEPTWRGFKKPDWCLSQSVSFEIRLYPHVSDRAHQVLFRCDNDRNRGGTAAKEEFNRWRDTLQQLAQKDANRFDDALSLQLTPAELAALPREASFAEELLEELKSRTGPLPIKPGAPITAAELAAAPTISPAQVSAELTSTEYLMRRAQLARSVPNDSELGAAVRELTDRPAPKAAELEPEARRSSAAVTNGLELGASTTAARDDFCAGCSHERCWHDGGCSWIGCACPGFADEPRPPEIVQLSELFTKAAEGESTWCPHSAQDWSRTEAADVNAYRCTECKRDVPPEQVRFAFRLDVAGGSR